MRNFTLPILVMVLLAKDTFAAPTDDVYQLGPDSLPQKGVPQGKVVGPLTLASKVFQR